MMKAYQQWPADKWIDVRHIERSKGASGFDAWAKNNVFDVIIKTWDPDTDEFVYSLEHSLKLRYCQIEEDGEETDDWTIPRKLSWSWSGHGRIVAFRIQREPLNSLNDARADWEAQFVLGKDDPLDEEDSPRPRVRKSKADTRKLREDEV